MKKKLIKREVVDVIYVCEYCGKESKNRCDIDICKMKCIKKKLYECCEHEFFLDVYIDVNKLKCKKCGFIEKTNTISIYDIKNYLTKDNIKKMYEENNNENRNH